MATDDPRGLEACEDKSIDELFEGHAILQAEGHGDGEAVEQAPERGTLAVHVDENLSQRTVVVFAGPEIDLVGSHHCLLGVTDASIRQPRSRASVSGGFVGDLLDRLLGLRLGVSLIESRE